MALSNNLVRTGCEQYLAQPSQGSGLEDVMGSLGVPTTSKTLGESSNGSITPSQNKTDHSREPEVPVRSGFEQPNVANFPKRRPVRQIADKGKKTESLPKPKRLQPSLETTATSQEQPLVPQNPLSDSISLPETQLKPSEAIHKAELPSNAPQDVASALRKLQKASKPIPGSRSGKAIFYHIPVSSPTWSSEEYQERFSYVVAELRRAVAEHNGLRPSGRFIIYSLHMIGTSVETAIPSILVQCRRSEVKSIRSLFNEKATDRLYCRRDSIWHRLFKETAPPKPPFHLVYFPTDLAPLRRDASDGSITAFLASDQTMCGTLLQHQGRIATVGLTLDVDGIGRLLTVDHLFYHDQDVESSLDYAQLNVPVRSIPNNSSLEIASRSPVPSDIARGKVIKPSVALNTSAPYGDWALVELSSASIASRRQNMIFTGVGSKPMLLQSVAKAPRFHGVPVYIVSGVNGIRTGSLLTGFSYLGGKHGHESCSTWTVILDSAGGGLVGLVPGECGSIVVDQGSYEVYGHVVGSNFLGHAYAVPLMGTIEQVKVCFSTNIVSLTPSKFDTAATMASAVKSVKPYLQEQVIQDIKDDDKSERKRILDDDIESLKQKSVSVSWSSWNDPLKPDSWESQFSASNAFDTGIEDKSFVHISQRLDNPRVHHEKWHDNVVSAFMLGVNLQSRTWQYRSHIVENFCLGASTVLDRFFHLPFDMNQTRELQLPRAWVVDRIWNPAASQYIYEKNGAVPPTNLLELLRKTRIRKSLEHNITDLTDRRIYVTDPDGSSILALIRVAPSSQVNALRQLFSRYVTVAPKAVIDFRDTTFQDDFELHFNLPYFALSNTRHDIPSPFRDRRRLRRSYNISFSGTVNSESNDENAPRLDQADSQEVSLHEALISCVVTGLTEQDWTSVCFSDSYFDNEMSFFENDMGLDDEESAEKMNEGIDPITFRQAGLSSPFPRVYFLQALAHNIEKVIDCHTELLERIELQEVIEAAAVNGPSENAQIGKTTAQNLRDLIRYPISQLRDQLDLFLTQDAMVGPDGVPKGRLMHNLRGDIMAIKALRSIMKSNRELRDLKQRLSHMRHARKQDHAEDFRQLVHYQEDLGHKLELLTFFGVFIGILSLIAQLYSAVAASGLRGPI
ncbi:Fc.00g008600.m01.CDS01 [Cosmosporella sp. VM-42]